MNSELEAIRTRHNNVEPPEGFYVSLRDGQQAHADRATLLAHVSRLSAELASARQAIKVQASAVKTLQAAEDSEINVLRSKATEAHRAVVTLDSERAMNATLTEEIDRLSAELAKERERRVGVEPWSTCISGAIWAEIRSGLTGRFEERFTLHQRADRYEMSSAYLDECARILTRRIEDKLWPATQHEDTP